MRDSDLRSPMRSDQAFGLAVVVVVACDAVAVAIVVQMGRSGL